MSDIITFTLAKDGNVINGSILPDGTIKTETSKISAPVHSNAEGFLGYIAKLAGGITKRVRKGSASHSHTHTGEEHTH